MSRLEQLSLRQTDASVNIAIVGEVSSGKSTTLNSIFVQNYNATKRKRSTCSVNIYCERTPITPVREIMERNRLSDAKIDDKNFSLVENVYNVSKMVDFGERKHNVAYNVIDLPGLNDSSSDAFFRHYITDNFKHFDAVIFISDGNKSMNTAAERELIQYILNHMLNNTRCQLIVAISKVDEPHDPEIREVCEAAKQIINSEVMQRKLLNRVKILTFSAEQGYLLRYIKHKKDLNELDDKNIAKLATLMIGSKWRRDILKERATDALLTQAQKIIIASHLKKIIENPDEMDEYYHICNYHGFINAFKLTVTDNIQQIYSEKVISSLNILESNWDTLTLFNKTAINLKQIFGQNYKPVWKNNEILKNVLLCPDNINLDDMSYDQLMSHIRNYKIITLEFDFDDETIDLFQLTIHKKIKHIIENMKEKNIDGEKIISLIRESTQDSQSIKRILFTRNTQVFIDTIYNVSMKNIANMYDPGMILYVIILKYYFEKEDREQIDNVIINYFEQAREIDYMDFIYHIEAFYDKVGRSINNYPLLKKLIILTTRGYSFTVEEVVEYHKNATNFNEPITTLLEMILNKYSKM